MLCACHGEPLLWEHDKRKTAGGYWRCRVKRQQSRAAHDAVAKSDRQRRYWHKADGGYIKRRRKTLAAERAEILRRLHDIEQEASCC